MYRKFKYSYFNTLRFKVTTSLFIVALIPLLINIALNNTLFTDNFNTLENQKVERKINKARMTLKFQGKELGKLALDYGLWSNVYDMVSKENINWFRENYSSWLPKYHGIDLVLVVNSNMKVLDSYGIDNGNPLELIKNEKILKMLNSSYNDKSSSNEFGFMEFQNSLYLIGASPILSKDPNRKSNGIVFLGKKVTSKLLHSINEDIGYELFIDFRDNIIYSNPNYIKIIETNKSRLGNSTGNVIHIADSNIMAKATLWDISQNNIGDLYIIESRKTFESTFSLMQKNALYALILTTICTLILSILLRQFIISPISYFEKQINDIKNSSTLKYVNVDGPTEISKLAHSFNDMVKKINSQKSENESLRIISITDTLTSLYNHRYFYEYLDGKILGGCRNITLIFCDMDDFATVNDSHGHLTGDKVLVHIASILKNTLGKYGTIFRYGGQQFAILLDDYKKDEALILGENLRLSVYENNALQKYHRFLPISLSVGIASYPEDSLTSEGLVSKADRAMCLAKRNGRNQCCFYNEDVERKLSADSDDLNKQKMMLNTVYAIAAAIDAKDTYTEKHSESVTKYSLLLAEKLNMSQDDKQILRIGGLLHDCGKIGIPDDIINKTSSLSDEEYSIIKKHPMLGSSIIKYITDNPNIASCVLYHHERWDGNGYPEGLEGEAIPFYARIISIADAYHAMISDRSYRKGLPKEVAFRELRRNSGAQFDPGLVEAFIEAVS